MARLVDQRKAAVVDGLTKAVGPDGGGPEDYLERVAKYVPVEIIAAYMFVRSIVPAQGASGAIPPVLELALFGALLVLNALYMWRFGGAVPKRGLQIAVSCISFVVWAYAIGGPFFWGALEVLVHGSVVYPTFAGVLVVLWALTAGFINPSKE